MLAFPSRREFLNCMNSCWMPKAAPRNNPTLEEPSDRVEPRKFWPCWSCCLLAFVPVVTVYILDSKLFATLLLFASWLVCAEIKCPVVAACCSTKKPVWTSSAKQKRSPKSLLSKCIYCACCPPRIDELFVVTNDSFNAVQILLPHRISLTQLVTKMAVPQLFSDLEKEERKILKWL